jgi:Ni,Fe-hydrogenase maturation factor
MASTTLPDSRLENAFRHAYHRRHGHPIKEFRRVGEGLYSINGIQVPRAEVEMMLGTMEKEIKGHQQSLVKRLIGFLGGRAAS